MALAAALLRLGEAAPTVLLRVYGGGGVVWESVDAGGGLGEASVAGGGIADEVGEEGSLAHALRSVLPPESTGE